MAEKEREGRRFLFSPSDYVDEGGCIARMLGAKRYL